MSEKKKRTEYPDADQDAVIEAWQTSTTAQEAADKLGMPKAILLARISKYRTAGITLKAMPRGRPKLDVGRLSAKAASLGDVEPAPVRARPHNSEATVSAVMKSLIEGLHKDKK